MLWLDICKLEFPSNFLSMYETKKINGLMLNDFKNIVLLKKDIVLNCTLFEILWNVKWKLYPYAEVVYFSVVIF